MKLWYCSLKSGVWGPAPKSELEKILKQGYLNKKTWVRKEGDQEWIALENSGIFEIEEIPETLNQVNKSRSTDSQTISDKESTGKKAHPTQKDQTEKIQFNSTIRKDKGNGTTEKFAPDKTKIATEKVNASKDAVLALGAKGQKALQSIDLDIKKEKAKETLNLYRLFWTRVLKSDFTQIKSTDDEIQKLETANFTINSPLAQDYSSWRRSMLMICILVLSISTFFSITNIFSLLGREDIHLIKKIQTAMLLLFQIGSLALCAFAAKHWCDLKKSRSLSRFAWLLQFLGPFLIFLVPLSLFVEDNETLAKLGTGAIIVLAPKVFGLFPGLIRCSLTVKTLLPETSTPGWLGIIIAPTYSLFLAMATIVAIQGSEIIMGVGFALLAVGMSVVILRSQLLLKPSEQKEASESVKGIKKKQLIFQIAGVSCIGFSIFLEVESLDWSLLNNLFLFIFSFIANVTLLTVVMSDFMLGMLRQGQLQASAFAGSDLEQSLTIRLDDLANSGLTDLEAGETELAANLKEKSGFLAKTASSHGSKLMKRAKQLTEKRATETVNSETVPNELQILPNEEAPINKS